MNRRRVLTGGAALLASGGVATALSLHSLRSTEEYDAGIAASRAALSGNPSLRELVRYATLAPSSHNTQPWLFQFTDGRVELLPDWARRTPIVDPDNHHLFVSLGCALENLVLAADAAGHRAEANFATAYGGSIALRLKPAKSLKSNLFDAIPTRQSTRNEYDGRPLDVTNLKTLAGAAMVPGVDLALVTDRLALGQVCDLVTAGNTDQMSDPAFRRELKHWLRFNPADAVRSGDGLFSSASGSPVLPSWAGPFLFDRFETVASSNVRYARQLHSSSGIAVFLSAHADPEHWVLVGRACQRFALQATYLGLKCAFINQPVEVARLRPELAKLVGATGRRPDILMRFGHSISMPYSARRPPLSVII